MMKQVYLFLVLIITCWGCQDMKVGYLKAENAGYLPNPKNPELPSVTT